MEIRVEWLCLVVLVGGGAAVEVEEGGDAVGLGHREGEAVGGHDGAVVFLVGTV